MITNLLPDAIDQFVRARRNRPRWNGVSRDVQPGTMEAGYRIQAAISSALSTSGVRRIGYKVGATTSAGQRAYGISEPIYAAIFDDTAFPSLAEALSREYTRPSVECEVAVCLAKDVAGPNVGRDEILGAIDWCRLACEIIDGRYPDPLATGVPTLIADGFFNAGFVLGPPTEDWRDVGLSDLEGEIEMNGTVVTGTSASGLNPIESVMWLSAKLAEVDLHLEAGDIILTGSLVPPVPIPRPLRTLSLTIEGFGRMTL